MNKKSTPAGRPLDRSKDEAIFMAARELLFGQGIQFFTMEAIASRAAVSKATLYSRFANREQILQAVVQYEASTLAADLKTGLQSNLSLYDTLMTFSIRLLQFSLDPAYQTLLRTLPHSAEISAELLQQIYQQGPEHIHQQLTEWVMHAQQAGLLQACSAESTELFCGMLMGMNWVKISYNQPVDNSPEAIKLQAEKAVNIFLKLHQVKA